MIDVYPRYRELAGEAGSAPPAPADRAPGGARFSVDDIRDLQVWQKLAWIDPSTWTATPRIRGWLPRTGSSPRTTSGGCCEVELEAAESR